MRSAHKPWSQIGAICAALTLVPMIFPRAAMAQEQTEQPPPAEAAKPAEAPPPTFRGGRGRGDAPAENTRRDNTPRENGRENRRENRERTQPTQLTPGLAPAPTPAPTPQPETRRNGRAEDNGRRDRGDGDGDRSNRRNRNNDGNQTTGTPWNNGLGQSQPNSPRNAGAPNSNGRRDGTVFDKDRNNDGVNDRNNRDRNRGDGNRRDDNTRDRNGRGSTVIDRNDRDRDSRARNGRSWDNHVRDRNRRHRGPDYRWRGAPPRIIIQRYYSLPSTYYNVRPDWGGALYDEDIWDSFELAVYDALPYTAREKHEQAFQVALYARLGETQSWWHGSVRGDITMIDERIFGDEWCRDFVQTIRAPTWTRTVDGRMCIDRGEPWRLVLY